MRLDILERSYNLRHEPLHSPRVHLPGNNRENKQQQQNKQITDYTACPGTCRNTNGGLGLIVLPHVCVPLKSALH